ncbi:MAG: thermonuclease family protein [Defluviicoccus sp.]|nr:thermonuclease family protein [Defluviicoccus sp.]
MASRKAMLVAAVAMALGATGRPASAEIVGRASVIDGDTIEIGGQRVRLFGIDSPESSQLCRADNKPYRCGQQSALALADKIGERTVRCLERDIDRYQRVVAICFVGKEDLGSWLVKKGMALAFRRCSLDYVAQEDEAQAAKRGVWRGEFEPPWEWRAAHSRSATGANSK